MPLDASASKTSKFLLCFLCKYISTYFFLTHIPTHKCKLNLYLPLPIPFQIIDCVISKRVWCMPVPLVHQRIKVPTVFVCVSIFQLISSLPTYPPTNGNLTYTYLTYSIPDYCCVISKRVMPALLVQDSWKLMCLFV